MKHHSVRHDDLMRQFQSAGVYLVTSGAFSGGRSTQEIIREALDGGVRLIQLREKAMADGELFRLAVEARRLTREAGALLIINDRLDIAIGCGADGVHLGREDLPADVARRTAPDLIIGVSTHCTGDVIDAQARGASYVNIGPLFKTGTKEGFEGRFLGVDGLKKISPSAEVPFTVMGGIKKEHIAELVAAGARTIAVVTAITAAADPGNAARELLAEIRRAMMHSAAGNGDSP